MLYSTLLSAITFRFGPAAAFTGMLTAAGKRRGGVQQTGQNKKSHFLHLSSLPFPMKQQNHYSTALQKVN